MENQEPAGYKLFLLFVVPPLLVGTLTFAFLFADFSQRSAGQQTLYGEATADQLSAYLAPYVVENNLLSLNIVTTDLVRNDYIQFVSVYDEGNALIAQSGRDTGDTTVYTSEITFQDSVVGFVRVAVINAKPANLLWFVILIVFLLPMAIVLLRKPAVMTSWLFANREMTDNEKVKVSNEDNEPIAAEADYDECILVARIRPAPYMKRYFEKFFHAAEIYGGIVEQTMPEELVVHFNGQDAMFNAASTGLLIKELANLLQGNMTFGGTLDVISEEPDKTRKAASYLASIAEGDLLIAGGEKLLEDSVLLETFHHSLVDSKDLCRINSLTNQALIDGQAKQLI